MLLQLAAVTTGLLLPLDCCYSFLVKIYCKHYHLLGAPACMMLSFACCLCLFALQLAWCNSFVVATACLLLLLASCHRLLAAKAYLLLMLACCYCLLNATACLLLLVACYCSWLPATACWLLHFSCRYRLFATIACLLLALVCCNLLQEVPLAAIACLLHWRRNRGGWGAIAPLKTWTGGRAPLKMALSEQKV